MNPFALCEGMRSMSRLSQDPIRSWLYNRETPDAFRVIESERKGD